jgi:hypothetical protein
MFSEVIVAYQAICAKQELQYYRSILNLNLLKIGQDGIMMVGNIEKEM